MSADDLSVDFSALMKGTNAHLVSDTSASVMHGRMKVPLPIPPLNCIFGGGCPMGVIIEAYGEPGSGKTSTWYQAMGNFQDMYPRSVSIIVDTEVSTDADRMPFMDIVAEKTMRIPCDSIEKGFQSLFTILDRKEEDKDMRDLPVFVIWDTISVGATDKQLDTGELMSAGMMAKPRIIKQMLQLLMPRIEKQPIIVVLLNQVTTEMTNYGGRLSSGGGWAIKHNAHLRFRYKGGTTDYDGIYALYEHSTVSLEKSKISPLFKDIPVLIDITAGGLVDSAASMAMYAADSLGYIKHAAWCNSNRLAEMLPEYEGCFGKFCMKGGPTFRYNEYLDYARNTPDYVTLLELAFTKEICEKYAYQAAVCKPYLEELRGKLAHLIEPETDVRVGPNGDVFVSETEGKVEEVPSGESFEEFDGKTIDKETGEVLDL